MNLPRAASLVETALPFLNPEVSPPPASGSPLHTLTTGLARGDDVTWTRFHRDFGPGIFRQLLAATRGGHALARGAPQQTYLRVARHARPCDSAPMFSS
ncbi:MAG: hypothetical protein H7343_02760 [Undibacterium sp.]|nr:hypothetical protein [Opitutaceae bacterium]